MSIAEYDFYALSNQINLRLTILEVGLGGRLDATNVIDTPLATLITPLSLDHQPILGKTLRKITGEKIGIAKKDAPIFSTTQPKDCLIEIDRRAQELTTPLYKEATSWSYISRESDFIFQLGTQEIHTLPKPSLQGTHQLQNSSLALATLHTLGLIKDWNAAGKALRSLSLKGRLMDVSYKGKSFWIDGAHNKGGAQTIAHHIESAWAGDSINLIFSTTRQDDISSFLIPLKPFIHNLYCPHLLAPFVDSSHVEVACTKLDIPFHRSASLESCLTASLEDSSRRTLVTGSLYLVGEILKLHHLI